MPPRRGTQKSAPRRFRPTRPKNYSVICAGCGKEVVIQVPPPVGKELLCLECFRK